MSIANITKPNEANWNLYVNSVNFNDGTTVSTGSSTQSVGNYVTDTFNRTSLGTNYFVNNPAMTITLNNGLTLAGGAADTNNFIAYQGVSYAICPNDFTCSMTFTPTDLTLSQGINLGIRGVCGLPNYTYGNTGVHGYGTVMSIHTVNRYVQIAQNTDNGTFTTKATSVGTLTWGINNTYKYTLIKRGTSYKAFVSNITTGESVFVQYQALLSTNAAYFNVVNNSGLPVIMLYGGTYSISKFVFTNDDISDPNSILFVGDSITRGVGSTANDDCRNSYPGQVMKQTINKSKYIVQAGPADQTQHVLLRLPELIKYASTTVSLMIGTNDAWAAGDAKFVNLYQPIVTGLLAAGKNVVLLYPPSITAGGIQNLNTMIFNAYGSNQVPGVSVVDTYTAINAIGTSAFADSTIHPNDIGCAAIARDIIKSGALPLTFINERVSGNAISDTNIKINGTFHSLGFVKSEGSFIPSRFLLQVPINFSGTIGTAAQLTYNSNFSSLLINSNINFVSSGNYWVVPVKGVYRVTWNISFTVVTATTTATVNLLTNPSGIGSPTALVNSFETIPVGTGTYCTTMLATLTDGDWVYLPQVTAGTVSQLSIGNTYVSNFIAEYVYSV